MEKFHSFSESLGSEQMAQPFFSFFNILYNVGY